MIKKFAVIAWILIATNWYSASQESTPKSYYKLEKLIDNNPPVIKKAEENSINKISNTGLHFGAVLYVDVCDRFSILADNYISNVNIYQNSISEKENFISRINIPLLTRHPIMVNPSIYIPTLKSDNTNIIYRELQSKLFETEKRVYNRGSSSVIFYYVKYSYQICKRENLQYKPGYYPKQSNFAFGYSFNNLLFYN